MPTNDEPNQTNGFFSLQDAYDFADEFAAWLLDDDTLADWNSDDRTTYSHYPNLYRYMRVTGTDLTKEYLGFLGLSKQLKRIPATVEAMNFILQIVKNDVLVGRKAEQSWKKTVALMKRNGRLIEPRKDSNE